MMPSKYARVDFTKCRPQSCDHGSGSCQAVISCSRRLLEQEEEFECPMLMSPTMCVGCGDCVRACPLGAIGIELA